MQVNTIINDGRDQNYYQDQAYEQMAIQTSAGSAETSAGGVQLHMVPKEGGNTFKGSAYAGISPGKWQGDNFTQRLKEPACCRINRVDRIFDYNATLGGPIVRTGSGSFSRGGTGACTPPSWTVSTTMERRIGRKRTSGLL